jgi:hypothetical protein
MSDQKRVVTLALDSYGGIFVKDAPEDIVLVLLNYDEGERAIDGMNIDDPDVTEELDDQGVEVLRDVVVGGYPDGTPITGDEALVRYVITSHGICRPGRYGEMMTDEQKVETDALFERYATKVEV